MSSLTLKILAPTVFAPLGRVEALQALRVGWRQEGGRALNEVTVVIIFFANKNKN
jgi:hypothetical protein